MKKMALITSLLTVMTVSVMADNPLSPEELIQETFKNTVENMKATESDYEKYFSKDYIQHVDGKVLNYKDFIAHMKAQKKALKSVKVVFKMMVAEGNKVATLHMPHAIKKDGKEVEAQVIAIFEVKDGKIVSCNELTRLVKGEEFDRDLGSRK